MENKSEKKDEYYSNTELKDSNNTPMENVKNNEISDKEIENVEKECINHNLSIKESTKEINLNGNIF
jgi:hypothetical protein